LTLLKLFKLRLQSYVKKIKRVNLHEIISLFKCANSYISSHYKRFYFFRNSIRDLKTNKQRWGRW